MENKEFKFNINKYIVGKFVKPEKINWAREIKISKKLVKSYPNEEFWRGFELTFKLNSLAWFISGDGEIKIRTDYNLFSLQFDKNDVKSDLSNEKFGEDKIIEKVPKNTLEFLIDNLL